MRQPAGRPALHLVSCRKGARRGFRVRLKVDENEGFVGVEGDEMKGEGRYGDFVGLEG